MKTESRGDGSEETSYRHERRRAGERGEAEMMMFGVVVILCAIVSGALILLPLAVAYPFIHEALSFPSEPWRLAAAVPALFLSALVQFTIAYCFGLMTFWFLEIQGLVVLSMAVEAVLGGQIFPLDLLPPALHAIARFLPFYYQMYFPAAILTGRIGPTETAEGLALQAGWVVLLLLLAHALWVRGLRRHTAVGG